MPQICFVFVKIIPKKNDNFDLALRKRHFRESGGRATRGARPAFGTQNNRFYKALITRELNNRSSTEKYLQLSYLLFYIIMKVQKIRKRK